MDPRKETRVTIHEIYIKAPAEQIWEAITSPDWTVKYGYRTAMTYDLKPGGRFAARATPQMQQFGLPETVVDGEVIEAAPPRRLVQTFRFLFSAQNVAEGFTRLTYDIEPTSAGFCRLRITHDVTGAPMMERDVTRTFSERGGGGWSWTLSDLKSLLETGRPLSG
jgi:uncharacterized protein YndB with AHSA1/START domain